MRTLIAVVVLLTSVTAVCQAEVIEVEGELSSLDPSKRTLTIAGKTYPIAAKCDVLIEGTPARLEDVPATERVTVKYDDKFEMVSEILVGQPTWLFYDLQCNGKTPETITKSYPPMKSFFFLLPRKAARFLSQARNTASASCGSNSCTMPQACKEIPSLQLHPVPQT